MNRPLTKYLMATPCFGCQSGNAERVPQLIYASTDARRPRWVRRFARPPVGFHPPNSRLVPKKPPWWPSANPAIWRPSRPSTGGTVRPCTTWRSEWSETSPKRKTFLQEIFLQAYSKLPSFEGRAAFGTWLYRLAVNRCLDHLRSGAAQRQSVTRSLDDSAGLSPSTPPEPTTARLDLENAILQLPQSYRAAFLLYDVEGFGHREVADILGVAEGTSKSLVHKARLKLRELLGKSRREKSGD